MSSQPTPRAPAKGGRQPRDSFWLPLENAAKLLDLGLGQFLPFQETGQKRRDLTVEEPAEKRAADGMRVFCRLQQRPEVILAAFLVERQRPLSHQAAQQRVNGLGPPMALVFERADDLVGCDRRSVP